MPGARGAGQGLATMMEIATSGTTGSEGRERRRNDRFAGPFDGVRVGLIEMPLSIFDLSRGGCFINCMHEQTAGVTFVMKIDLPDVGLLTLTAETLPPRAGFGFGVRFVDVDDHTADLLDRALDTLERLA
jgi:hypothetical protein